MEEGDRNADRGTKTSSAEANTAYQAVFENGSIPTTGTQPSVKKSKDKVAKGSPVQLFIYYHIIHSGTTATDYSRPADRYTVRRTANEYSWTSMYIPDGEQSNNQ